MREALMSSAYLGFAVTIGSYLLGIALKKKVNIQIFNPLLAAVIFVMIFLKISKVPYENYYEGAKYISYFLTPATVCLAIPLYKQLALLKENLLAVMGGILSGVIASAVSIFAMSKLFSLSHQHYVSLLPKSITTAIGIGISEEAGGIVTLTVVSIVITGILGNVLSELLFQLVKIKDPVAKGLALGTASHAIGTTKALELGEIEGAMSSLAIAVAGIMTVVIVPLISGLI